MSDHEQLNTTSQQISELNPDDKLGQITVMASGGSLPGLCRGAASRCDSRKLGCSWIWGLCQFREVSLDPQHQLHLPPFPSPLR